MSTFTLIILSHFLLITSSTSNDESEFYNFITKFRKTYFLGTEPYEKAFHKFKANRIHQIKLNRTHKLLSAYYGPTKFSDLSYEEFREQYLSDLKVHQQKLSETAAHTPLSVIKSSNLPKRIDWRNHNNRSHVTDVKNQLKCGACWAFSATETIESMKSIQTGKLPPILSVQEVIDCAAYNSGCNGGDPFLAVKWLRDTQTPLTTNKKYPLTDTSDFCRLITNNSDGVIIKTCNSYRLTGKEDQILQLLNKGPVSVAVDASTWNNYMGGIIQYHCEARINHAVQIVGYDMTGDVPYYIVRNSWGTDYGDKGYLYIKIGENLCGIAEEVTTVTVL